MNVFEVFVREFYGRWRLTNESRYPIEKYMYRMETINLEPDNIKNQLSRFRNRHLYWDNIELNTKKIEIILLKPLIRTYHRKSLS